MSWSSKLLLASALALSLFGSPALASSNLAAGRFAEAIRGESSNVDLGSCRFYTGPRDDLTQDQFLMILGDREAGDGDELQVTGTFRLAGQAQPQQKQKQKLQLFPDKASAEGFFEARLRDQFGDPSLEFHLQSLTAGVNEVHLPAQAIDFNCRVHLTGRATGDLIGARSIVLGFGGDGQFIRGESSDAALVRALSEAAPAAAQCPLAQLAPAGLVPACDRAGCRCTTGSCLLDFKGYRWWSNYNFFGPPFPQSSYYWNANNQWSPQNATVDGEGLHLFIRNQDVGGGSRAAASEVVLMFNADGSEANLGYGDYLVTATVKTASSWDRLDPNATFGAFTYERWGTSGSGTGDVKNPYRELDLAEISRWGHTGGTCGAIDPRLCTGNAQFTLQDWHGPENLHRYSISSQAKTVTLVMRWHGANQPVTFEQYDGAFTLQTLPAQADVRWTTSTAQNPYVPATNCERFHLNLWMGNYADARNGFNPPPAGTQEVVISNFEFQPH